MDLNDKIAARRREVERERQQAAAEIERKRQHAAAEEAARRKAEEDQRQAELQVARQEEEMATASNVGQGLWNQGYVGANKSNKTVEISLESLPGIGLLKTILQVLIAGGLCFIALFNLFNADWIRTGVFSAIAWAYIAHLLKKRREAAGAAPTGTPEKTL